MAIYYIKSGSDEKTEVVVEYDLIEIAPDYMTPKLVFLFFKPKEPIDDFEAYFYTHELIANLTSVDGLGYFAGARFLDGWVELYYYARDSKALRQELTGRLPLNTQHEVGSKADDKWRFFFEFLRPDAFEKLSIENRFALEELQDAGDDLNTIHEFDHTFFFDTPTQREKVKKELLALGHQIEDETIDESLDARFVLVTQHKGVANLEEVNAFSKQISDIVERAKGYYDGWSTQIKEPA